jgi:hypothetical protein
MSKFTVECFVWRQLCRHALCGFARIRVAELKFVIHDAAPHQKGDRRWAALSARPWVRDGAVIGDDGKIQYLPIMDFEGSAVREAFSCALVNAVLARDPKALSCPDGVA